MDSDKIRSVRKKLAKRRTKKNAKKLKRQRKRRQRKKALEEKTQPVRNEVGKLAEETGVKSTVSRARDVAGKVTEAVDKADFDGQLNDPDGPQDGRSGSLAADDPLNPSSSDGAGFGSSDPFGGDTETDGFGGDPFDGMGDGGGFGSSDPFETDDDDGGLF
jgi:hypothetical protein